MRESKYAPFGWWLRQQDPEETEVTLQFGQIEALIGDGLPPSARQHAAWWANERNEATRHVQARAWLENGWEVGHVDMQEETVTFHRTGEATASEGSDVVAAPTIEEAFTPEESQAVATPALAAVTLPEQSHTPATPPAEAEPPRSSDEPSERDERGANVVNSRVSLLSAREVHATNSAFREAQVDRLELRNGAIGMARAGEATVVQGGAGALIAQESLSLKQGGGSVLVAGNRMTVQQGGGSLLIAGSQMEVEQGGGAVMIAGEATVREGFIGLLLTGRAELGEGVRVLLTLPQALALGAGLGLVLALVGRFRR